MPASGPVYQPTTVSYEQQGEWSRPASYLSQTVSGGVRGPRCVQWVLLALAIFSLSAGVIMVAEGTVDFTDNKQTPMTDEHGNVSQPESKTGQLIITVAGALLIIMGILLIGVYIRLVRRRKGCPCLSSKEQRLARQLDNQVSNGQYGPVSEISYLPPQHDAEETRKLMASDNKECRAQSVSGERVEEGKETAEVGEKGRESRRVQRRNSLPVIRYRNRQTSRAPLASQEDITPSLRSSFSSADFYSPTDSIRSSLLESSPTLSHSSTSDQELTESAL
ncbi:uncharacterized protein LOC124354008 isoform X2 [Homalodisca vitripennis]|uniref:uncharacterized protein LOC124354008 isoform X2 n=1 Tax=Homalodisca vitripennis TaxID=197043 RepID=UPI001EEC28D4|nr:uncharacterized protein LOC124354008 isoform X2 [Homalodisca vitripennis]